MAQERKTNLESSIRNRKNEIIHCIHLHKNIQSNRNNEKENFCLFSEEMKKKVFSEDEVQISSNKKNTKQIKTKHKSELEKVKRKPLQNISKTNNTLDLKKNTRITSLQTHFNDINEEFPIQKNFKLVTTQRNFDFLDMNNLSIECSSAENYFFEDEIVDSLENPNSTMTPANSFVPQNHIKAIKEIRKGISKYSESISEKDKKIISRLHMKKYNQIDNSKISFLNKVKHDQIKNKENIKSYLILGAVNLDPEENFVMHSVLYPKNYLKSILEHQLKREITYKLSDSFLHKFTITNMNRSIVINWLIKLQAYMKIEHIVVYTAVRIMDRALDTLNIPLNMLQLVALASFWISLKFHAVNHREVSWMVKQSDGAYTNNELIMMERRIFHANNFDIIPIDYSTYIHYYVLYLELGNADMIAQCSYYIMDCALLDCRFVRILPSMIAAASIYTTLHLLNQYRYQTWIKLKNHIGYYSPEELTSIKVSLVEMLKEVNNPNFVCREPFYKFSSKRYLSVSHIIAGRLACS